MLVTSMSVMGFNPTLVRLRPCCTARDLAEMNLFQSHAGSIEAISRSLDVFAQEVFQSHAGSIEAPLLQLRDSLRFVVSIPRWFD